MADEAPESTEEKCPEYATPWGNKTTWVYLITSIAGAFPPVAALIAANPGLVPAVVGAVYLALRYASGKKLPLIGSSGKPIKLKAKKK